jgi:hypothetical protein
MMIITTLLWWFVSPRLHEISSLLATGILTILRLFYFVVLSGIILLFLECYTRFSNKVFLKVVRFSIKLLFPINVFVGKIFNVKKDKIRESYVQVNNSFIKSSSMLFSAKDILILLPHCLQKYECVYRITNNINNCIDCKGCVICDLKKLSYDFGVKIAIATGGTLARKIIVETKPRCIIAVACQRDLVDGLMDVFPIPVYGILNKRPHGPCINTTLDVCLIAKFLEHFIQEDV